MKTKTKKKYRIFSCFPKIEWVEAAQASPLKFNDLLPDEEFFISKGIGVEDKRWVVSHTKTGSQLYIGHLGQPKYEVIRYARKKIIHEGTKNCIQKIKEADYKCKYLGKPFDEAINDTGIELTTKQRITILEQFRKHKLIK